MGVSVGVSVGVAVEVEVGVMVTVGVNVGVKVMVGVAVAGCELWLVMRGLTQSPKSSCDDPFDRIVNMNFTFCPFRKLRSISIA